jgi:hypothetical protein
MIWESLITKELIIFLILTILLLFFYIRERYVNILLIFIVSIIGYFISIIIVMSMHNISAAMMVNLFILE